MGFVWTVWLHGNAMGISCWCWAPDNNGNVLMPFYLFLESDGIEESQVKLRVGECAIQWEREWEKLLGRPKNGMEKKSSSLFYACFAHEKHENNYLCWWILISAQLIAANVKCAESEMRQPCRNWLHTKFDHFTFTYGHNVCVAHLVAKASTPENGNNLMGS